MTTADPPRLLTPGRIAEELGATLAQVQRALAANPQIRPVARAGTLRVYQRRDLPLIFDALACSSAKRATRKVVPRDSEAQGATVPSVEAAHA